MGSIRVRNETGKLFFDFKYQNVRCREQTTLEDTKANRAKLQKVMDKIDAEIMLGQFAYRDYFPNSSFASKFDELDARRRSYAKDATPFFKDFAWEWYAEMEVGWRNSHKVTVKRLLGDRIMDYFGEMEVSRITKADVLKFRASLGKVVRKDGETISAEYINKYMKILRMPLDEAADRFNFTSPYRGIKPLKKPKPHIDPFSLEEVNKILDTVRSDFKPYYTIRFFTGMRTAEIDGLKWKYVDFERRQILIRETLVKGVVEYAKTEESQREIEMSQPVYEAFKQQWAFTGGKFDYVFVNRAGEPLEYNNVSRRVWHPLLRYLELPRRKAYQTRHTAATLWLASGENPEWIAKQMGHTTTEMLFRVYSRFVPNLTRKDGSAFERLLAANLEQAKGVAND
ncbi:Arm DNA-binding domain-containing protein [Methylomonas sp. HW2-6]|uniref:Arm DNA-binding domain-containing protein n=1 Tax=Methylomonas sp. HW2-6 TaxID=3376687 RepID=UPI0040436A74